MNAPAPDPPNSPLPLSRAPADAAVPRVDSRSKASAPTEPAAPAPGRRRRLWLVGAMTILGIALAIVAAAWRHQGRHLPPLPDLSVQPPAVAQHLREADRRARWRPRASNAVGALGMAYHGDLFPAEAAQCYDRAALLDPTQWRWRYYRGVVAQETGDPAGVEVHMQAVLTQQPRLALAWWRLGEALFKQGRTSEAAEAYRRAIEFDQPAILPRPHDKLAFDVADYAAVALARLELERGEAQRAVELLRPVAQRSPRFGPGQRWLVQAYEQLGRDGEARRHAYLARSALPPLAPPDPLLEALADESHSSTYLLREGRGKTASGLHERAIALSRRALELHPADTDAELQMGVVLRAAGRYEDALPFMRRAVELRPEDPLELYNLGRVLSILDRPIEAEHFLRRSLHHRPDDVPTLLNLGTALESQWKLSEAEACYRRAIELRPDRKLAYHSLGLFLADRGRFAEAAEVFAAGLMLPGDAELTGYLEMARVAGIPPEQVVQTLLQAAKAKEDHPDGLGEIGSRLAQMGHVAEARDIFARLVALAPGDAMAHLAYAQLAARSGQADTARRHAAESLRLEPTLEPARRLLKDLAAAPAAP